MSVNNMVGRKMSTPMEQEETQGNHEDNGSGSGEQYGLFADSAFAIASGAAPGITDTGAARLPANDSWRKGRLCLSHVRLLGRDVPASLITLGIAEALVFMAAFIVAVHIRFPEGAGTASGFFDGLNAKLGLFVAVNLVAMLSMGLFRRGFIGAFTDVVLRVAGAFILSSAILAAVFYLFPSLFFGRGVLVLSFVMAFAGVITTRVLLVRLLGLSALKRRVLVLGSGHVASMFSAMCNRSESRGFELVNFTTRGNETTVVDPGRLVNVDLPLDEYARLNHIDDIVIALDDHRGGLPVAELIACKMHGIDVLQVSDFFERECGFLKLDNLRPSAMIFSSGFRQSLYRDFIKRAMDVMASFGMLLFAWPFMLITAMGIYIESRGQGTVLFRQERVGQNGKIFTLYKFRSMIMDAESDGVARWASKEDPRVTRFGSFIRKTRLDELPQLFNVLRGDMSFVGPRPERPEFVGKLGAKLPFYNDRHWVKPGVTGWAQINYPYGASEKDAFEKLQYDLYYVKNQGIALDLMIIAQTVEVVLWGRGAR